MDIILKAAFVFSVCFALGYTGHLGWALVAAFVLAFVLH
jgi:hypothetical protein